MLPPDDFSSFIAHIIKSIKELEESETLPLLIQKHLKALLQILPLAKTTLKIVSGSAALEFLNQLALLIFNLTGFGVNNANLFPPIDEKLEQLVKLCSNLNALGNSGQTDRAIVILDEAIGLAKIILRELDTTVKAAKRDNKWAAIGTTAVTGGVGTSCGCAYTVITKGTAATVGNALQSGLIGGAIGITFGAVLGFAAYKRQCNRIEFEASQRLFRLEEKINQFKGQARMLRTSADYEQKIKIDQLIQELDALIITYQQAH